MSGWWVHELVQSGHVVELVSWIFWVIFSITMHELAHGWAALWQGDDTPRRLGRLTANPIVHMGPWSLVVFAVIGIAWGVMPVDPSRFRWGRRGRVVVSGAGPAMNIALAIVSTVLLIAWLRLGPDGSPFFTNVAWFLWMGSWLNLLLALFNLLPVPPLDGSSILSGLSLRVYQFYQRPQSQMVGMFIILAVLISGCGGIVFQGCQRTMALVIDLAGGLLGSPSLYETLYVA